MSKRECFCGVNDAFARGMCRVCYDSWYRRTHVFPEQIKEQTCIKPEKVRPSVTRFVMSLPVDRARQVALGKALMPGVQEQAERFWGQGG